jgi:hypothetical protein
MKVGIAPAPDLNYKLLTPTKKLLSKNYPHSNCTEIVCIDDKEVLPYCLGSSLGSGKITKYIRNITPFYSYTQSVLIGIILSDGWLQKNKANWNARLGFKQSIINFEYLWHVFQVLSPYCQSLPFSTKSVMRGRLFYSVEIQTRAYPFLTELHSLFYSGNKKVLPAPSKLFELLTPVALAHLIMCDGSIRNESIVICTDNFTIKEVVQIINVLIIKFRIECSIHYDNSYPRIYISRKSFTTLKSLINPFIVTSMQYKLLGRLERNRLPSPSTHMQPATKLEVA